MKKSLKLLLVAVLMVAALLILTGCGDKLVATKETESMGMKYEEKIEVSFKKDKVNKVKMTYKFEDKEAAEAMASMLKLAMSMADEEMDMDVKQSGKKVVMTVDAKAYAEMASADEADMTKDELKEMLEEEGYKVK